MKSTLVSLPIYFLSLFTILMHVAAKIEEVTKNFLWGTNLEPRRYLLLSLDKSYCLNNGED